MQFFDVDGIELDVQDPIFFIDEEQLIKQQEAIEEILEAYV